MSEILIQQNNEALVPPDFPTNVREQAPVLIQENILQDGGIAATVDVASTTTLDPDTPAYVNNIGDEKHAILQFGIPKGETGAAGVDGVDGQAATISVGSTTTVDPDESAAVVNSGTSQNAILDFSIPQGVQGIQGEQGISPRAYVEQTATGAMIHIDDYMTETNVEVLNGQDGADGQAATVSVGTTTTGAAGTNASVVNSGSTSAAVLDFTIPRGADGAAGRDGSDGFSPVATVVQNTGSATITITDAQGTTTATVYDGTAASLEWNDIQNKPNFATVATTGSYTDLTNTPTIPTQYYIKAGTETIPALNSGGYTEIQVSIPTQSNTDYAVCLTLAGSTSYWTWLRFIVINKTTSSFTIGIYNDGGGGSGSVPIDYIVMKI